MRKFSASYLADTRRGMWRERDALEHLELPDQDSVLDVGCGTGGLTTVLREESPGAVFGLDADRSLLDHVTEAVRVQGDARRLPFRDDQFDLVVCQALLVNLRSPQSVITEFARVSSELVAVIEPDNGSVTVESTVQEESALSRRARSAYIDGIPTDVTIGNRTAALFRAAGLTDVTSQVYAFETKTVPPYSAEDVRSVKRKATGERLAEQRETLLNGSMSSDEFDSFRERWRQMGRVASAQLQAGSYERVEKIPFYVTVGSVPGTM